MATNQLLGSVRQFAQNQHSKEFEVDPESQSIEACKNLIFAMPRTATKLLTVLSVSKSSLAVQSDRFKT